MFVLEKNTNQQTIENYKQVKFSLEKELSIAWIYMQAKPYQCFNLTLLNELNSCFNELATNTKLDVDYVVLASSVDGIYNLGGDLNLFRTLIINKDREGLRKYAKACIEGIYLKMNGCNRNIIHIALVQGDALGGGFECAISSDILIAERSAKLGFPEIIFNLFPGMGAYSILSRRVGANLARFLIESRKLYTAEELYEMKIVNVLVDDGKGKQAVYDYIHQEKKSFNTHKALHQIQRICNSISKEELIQIGGLWVDTALKLKDKDLKTMEKLVRKQHKLNCN